MAHRQKMINVIFYEQRRQKDEWFYSKTWVVDRGADSASN